MPTPREAFTNTVQRQGYSGARVQAADFGAAGETLGRAAQGFGQDVAKVGEQMEKIQERDAETAAREADNIRTAKRLKRFYEGPEGYFNQEGKNAALDQPKLEADLAAIDAETGSLLKGKPLAQRMFNDLTQKRTADDLPRIYQHASKQREAYDDQVDSDAFDLAIDSAATSLDPASIANNLDTVGGIAVRQAMRKGMTDDNTLRQVRQTAIGKGVSSVASAMARKSPLEAQAFVALHAKEMDPDDVGKLLDGLKGEAGEEFAETDIGNFEVAKGGYAPAAAAAAAATVTEGAPAPAGTGMTPMPPTAALEAAQWFQESRGQHTNASGGLTTSSAGARGISQVMPATGPNPGYGITPLRNQSREEYIRFGNDYRNAMLKEFGGNVVLALTAYNWGPGNLKAHIKKVGDPSKGQISDAAFLASIPVKEAKEYAPKILARAGSQVTGEAGPSAAQPAIPVGAETDLTATINNIMAADRTWDQKKALIAVANRRHGLGQQKKSEDEAALRDQAMMFINNQPPDSFTDFNKMPLNLRNELQLKSPETFNSLRNMADTNRDRQVAQYDANKRATFDANLAGLEQDLMAFRWEHPEEFKRINFYGSPKWAKMGTAKVTEWMKRQEGDRDADGGSTKGVNVSAVRAAVNNYSTKEMKTDPKKMGIFYDAVGRLEQQALADPARNGKPLNDVERQGLVMQALTPADYTVGGKTVRGSTRAEAVAAGATTSQVNMYDEARAAFQRKGVIPTPQQVEAAVQALKRGRR